MTEYRKLFLNKNCTVIDISTDWIKIENESKQQVLWPPSAVELVEIHTTSTGVNFGPVEGSFKQYAPQPGEIHKYSVSLVYDKHIIGGTSVEVKHSLRSVIVDAISEDEALGKAISNFKEEMKGCSLNLHCVIRIMLEIGKEGKG